MPLGGILARRKLGNELIGQVQSVVQSSIEYGLQNREETFQTMRQYAQEFDDDVLMKHVDLYVNEWTVELGEVGSAALEKMSQLCNETNSNESKGSIEVFSSIC